ncbi:MAG: permease YjgP/YjgQ family protein [Fluviicola sp.]|uniref:LptF/LptG family permease n=1 Tax=Fluviicola sp. TaxID=1917219 RepID=UPI0026285947|nr:LptF/LptG family permease [Fluviicola sp.]MDF3026332.1 permease YjgP/YjgQ family protein [Fluviicola sp.]
MKRLTVFSIQSFAGPFVVTFFISMVMLIMQFTWVYIDDLMGKGLSVGVIIELMFYVSASLIPLALPLAILLSSIMTLGNLAENNELTALKSSGLSLFRILRPLTQTVVLIAVATFFFSNYVIPVANLKWHTIIFDIQETKVGMLLTPGSYSKEIDGYAIKVKSGNDNTFYGITIHDYTDPNILKTVKADSGTVYKGDNGKYLLFHLSNGIVHEELQAQAPVFTNQGQPFHTGDFRPSRTTQFKAATYKMELVGFDLNKSDEELFKNDYEMLNVFQINEAKDSLQRKQDKFLSDFGKTNLNNRPFSQSINFEGLPKSNLGKPKVANEIEQLQAIPSKIIKLSDLTKKERVAAVNAAIVSARSMVGTAEEQAEFLRAFKLNYEQYQIEFHRKFALSGAIIVLFFVGAPLGAIVRKGGFGAPVVIAALLFMVYFVLFSVGQNLAGSGVLSPFWGMWLPTAVLIPIACILMVAAANDLGVFDRKLWRYILTFGRRR